MEWQLVRDWLTTQSAASLTAYWWAFWGCIVFTAAWRTSR